MTDEPQPSDPAEERAEAQRALERELRVLGRRFRQSAARNAQRLSPGMMPVVYTIFTTIAEDGPVTASTVVEELSTDKGLVSRAVRELESLGLIRRDPDPRDGRSSLLSATPEGRERLHAVRTDGGDRIARTLADWKVSEVRQLAVLLHALAEGGAPERP